MNARTKRMTVRISVAAVVAAAAVGAAALVTNTARAQSNDRRDRGGANRFERTDRTYRSSGFDRSRTADGTSAATPATPQVAQSSPARSYSYKPSEYSSKYAQLEQKNIFQKSRKLYVPPGEGGGERPGSNVPRSVEDSLILTGIALQEGRHVAFIENTFTYTTQRLTPGASIGRGKIVAVERDHIEYEANGFKSRIEIGHNFTGGAATPGSGGGGTGAMSVTGATSAWSGTSAASAGAPIDPNNPNLTVEERMKLRRQQEQQKK